jgi:phosphoglycolate phosphatase
LKSIIQPGEIQLLIFDMDGTIFESHKATFKVLKKAFADMGIDSPLSEQAVKDRMGEPAEQFFGALLGPVHFPRWQEIMEKYDAKIPQFGSAFPGVPETLDALKSRGYKLALCSNCARDYFEAVLLKTQTRSYFDFAECYGDDQLIKSQLVKKVMREKFPGLKAAVIGDRIHDIDAARDNGALAVGVLYGYGKTEPQQADITIEKFAKLLEIFPSRK